MNSITLKMHFNSDLPTNTKIDPNKESREKESGGERELENGGEGSLFSFLFFFKPRDLYLQLEDTLIEWSI